MATGKQAGVLTITLWDVSMGWSWLFKAGSTSQSWWS